MPPPQHIFQRIKITTVSSCINPHRNGCDSHKNVKKTSLEVEIRVVIWLSEVKIGKTGSSEAIELLGVDEGDGD